MTSRGPCARRTHTDERRASEILKLETKKRGTEKYRESTRD